ncbi:MAG TPA: SufD family Fe-S cluster assembly protein [Conexivisphaerales archaeon]|nr:SufD family Fe-S cluster assembly protein [Conexivisphaerales archaeon]
MSEMLLSRVRRLSKDLGEPEALASARAESLALYDSLPYERNVLFSKNFEKLPGDPNEFAPREGGKLPADVPYSVAVLGSKSLVGSLPKGVSFHDGTKEGMPLLSTPISGDEDKMFYLNAAFRDHSNKFIVAPGEAVREPIVRLGVSPPGRNGTFRSTEIDVGEASSSIFIDRIADSQDNGTEPALLSDLVEVRLRPNATLTFVTLSTGTRERIIHNTRFVLEDGARLTYVTWYAASPYVRAHSYVVLRGEGGEANLYWGGFPKESSRYDYMALVEHLGRSTKGFVLQRGLVKGQSRMLLKGLMTIRHSAVNADSHLSQHALLLTRDSFANAIPGLEIETNELKAKHAASVSQPDEDQLFYLMSRGLTKEESLMEIAGGYLNPLAVNIPDQAAREAFELEIGKALKG